MKWPGRMSVAKELTNDVGHSLCILATEYKRVWKEYQTSYAIPEPGAHTWLRYQDFLDFYALLHTYLRSTDLPYQLPLPSLDPATDIDRIHSVMSRIVEDIHASPGPKDDLKTAFADSMEKYTTAIPCAFGYELSDNDIARLQELIDELRTLTRDSAQLEEGHRRRLLERVEKLQRELNRKMSNLDVFWGLLGDAGVALGRFGKDVKPLTDRICEILKIICRIQAQAHQLPKGSDKGLLKAIASATETEGTE